MRKIKIPTPSVDDDSIPIVAHKHDPPHVSRGLDNPEPVPNVVTNYAAGRVLFELQRSLEEKIQRFRRQEKEQDANLLLSVLHELQEQMKLQPLAMQHVSALADTSTKQETPAPPLLAGHHTVLLQHLADAAREWWSTYDPSDPSTAPTNPEVEGWLVGRGVSKRIAEAMAQILRPNDLKRGPRR